MDTLAAERIQALLDTESIARELTVVETTGSTNADCLEAARKNSPHGYAVLANAQTGGRGRDRRGEGPRRWDSPPGVNLYTSVLLRPPETFRHGLVLATGAAVAETVFKLCGRMPALKWPNDVLWKGRKIAGILVQAALGAQVVGIGLNVNADPEHFSSACSVAGSMHEIAGLRLDRNLVAARLYGDLERWYKALAHDRTAVFSHWCKLAGIVGKIVTILTDDDAHLRFSVTGLDDDGFLIGVDENNRVVRAIAGDLITME